MIIQQYEKYASPTQRVLEFGKVFSCIDGKLHCNTCGFYIDHNPVNKVLLHFNNKIHVDNIERIKKNQDLCLNENVDKDDLKKLKNDTIINFTKMLFQCNIAITKVRYMKDWIQKYVFNGGAIPSCDQVRKYYQKRVFDLEEKKLKNIMGGDAYISIGVDSTPDGRGKQLLNGIAYTSNGKILLAHCEFVETENHDSLSEFLKATVARYSSWDKVMALISDNASKNLKAFSALISTYNPKILHLRCSKHVINLVLKDITHNDYFDIVYEYISALQMLFSHSPVKKNMFKDFLASNDIKYERFDGYIESRWCSFLQCCTHLVKYYDYYNMFLKNEDKSKSKSIKKIMNMLNHSYIDILWKINVIADLAHMILPISCALDSNKSQIFELSSMLSSVQIYLNKIMNSDNVIDCLGVYSANFMKIYSVEDLKGDYNKMIKLSVCKGIDKLLEYSVHNEAFFNSILIFNPKIKNHLCHTNLDYYYNNIAALSLRRCKELEREFEVYLNNDDTNLTVRSLNHYWESVKHLYPHLYVCYNIIKNIPVSNSHVERSFSHLRKILTDDRYCMSEPNVIGLLKFRINNNTAFDVEDGDKERERR